MHPAGDTPTSIGGVRLNARYDVVAPISSGAMGAVYRAVDRVSGQPVAVKRLLDDRYAARFEIEARLLASLSHPRVVEVIDHLRDEAGMYMVMTLVEGMDLGEALARRDGDGLPIAEATEYVRQACEALQYVHAQQIVHRDVKPQNMIIGEAGIVLVDFGVARGLAGAEESGTVAVGTPRFMAPEVFAGGVVSPASDVYGLAATLWTLIVGNPPRLGDPTRLEKVVPGASPELGAAVAGGLELLPEQRTPTAEAFAEALGVPLTTPGGESLAMSLERSPARRRVMEAVVRAAAGVFEAAAASIAMVEPATGDLVYEAAWGAGASQVVGLRLPRGRGVAGSVVESAEGVAVPDCRRDPRFAAQVAARTGYVPYTMLVVPLLADGEAIGVLSVLDRRDGGPYGRQDLVRAALFADLALVALDLDGPGFTALPTRP